MMQRTAVGQSSSEEIWLRQENELQEKFNSKKIEYEPCMTVTVAVISGKDISVGFLHDLVDIPDAKVYAKCSTAVGRKVFKTKVARNQKNPIWNETFRFVLAQDANDAIIEVDVYEEDSFKPDPHLGSSKYSIKDFEMGKRKKIKMKLKHGEVDLEILKEQRNQPDYRLSLGLCEAERQFRINRKPKTMKALQKFLGEKLGPKTLQETPTIAFAVSGGGYRAVANSCGAVEALVESSLFDTFMYFAGLSGSSWYISSSYLHRSLHSLESVVKHHEWLKERMKSSLTRFLFDISFYKRYREFRNFKMENHQRTTFVDFYGLCIGETFLGQEYTKETLSSLKEYVESTDVPYPILSCAHVHEYLPMSSYWDEVEMTPHEISIPSYGINIPSNQFNSRWGKGILQQELPAPPLHFMMGASGSAFAILWTKVGDKNEVDESLNEYINQSHASDTNKDETTVESSDTEDEADTPKIKAHTPNFASSEDKWIEKLEVEDAEAAEDDASSIGRSFILERTAKVINFARECGNIKKYLFNGNGAETGPNREDRFKRNVSETNRNILLCDSALGCNLPTIHVLRPQRAVDVLVIMDCSNYAKEDHLTMEIFATVQNQVYDHGIKFPRISIEKILEEPFREFYIFEDPDDPECPIVCWFTLSNKKFREDEKINEKFKTTEEDEKKFNDFSIFPESSDFGTMRLSFSERNFERLRELAKYNILSNMNYVKEKIAQKVEHLRKKR